MWRPSSAARRPLKSESLSKPPLSPHSTLQEVLRVNQFRVKNAPSPVLLINKQKLQDETTSLNHDLAILASVFADVKLDCLRELLTRFDGDSRLEICTEQLYRYKAEWTNGRTQVPPRDLDQPIQIEEQFRTESYRNACARLLYKEFGSLNKSAVDAVLAEVNYGYAKARPVLQEITNKSWRATIQSLFRRRKDRDTTPVFIWARGRPEEELVPTGSVELDQELEELFVRPGRSEQQAIREEQDYQIAVALNEKEATKLGALYECQICYSDVPFENISACTQEAHVLCLDCVRRSLNEAIFGQNWAQSVQQQFGTLRCLAPIEPRCEGHMPADHLKQAVLHHKSGPELWSKFEDRLAEKALYESQLPIVRCPFCSYAEAETTYTAQSARQINWHFREIPTHYKVFTILACEFLLPSLLFLFIFLRIIWPAILPRLFYTSIAHIASNQRPTRFRCLNPHCKRTTCLKCAKLHQDPHICNEPLLLSLRQSVESARTNAVKRVCPRCGTAFVKSSGCNKLTCICGYSMCYICRKNIGKTGENEGADIGYAHYCQHFRPVAGQKCTLCEKCDLYKTEQEDVLVKKAGEEAERMWRLGALEGEAGAAKRKEVEGLQIDHDGLAGQVSVSARIRRGDWTVQGISNKIVERLIVVDVR